MPTDASTEPVTHLVDPTKIEPIDVLGPTIADLTAPDGARDSVMLGTIAPGGVVPLHSHADPETLRMCARATGGAGHVGRRLRPDPRARRRCRPRPRRRQARVAQPLRRDHGDHQRQHGEAGAVLRRDRRPRRAAREPGSPSDETLRPFLQTAERYGCWNATPEENAAVGLRFG